jgi:hypothetical protein
VIPEIDIWHDANLMLKRYGDKALGVSDIRADELATAGDHDGAANLAPNYGCRRAARERRPARTAPLIGTDPQRPPPPALAGESHA